MVGLALTLVALGCGAWVAFRTGIITVERYQVMTDKWRSNLRRDYGEEDCDAHSRTKAATGDDETSR